MNATSAIIPKYDLIISVSPKCNVLEVKVSENAVTRWSGLSCLCSLNTVRC